MESVFRCVMMKNYNRVLVSPLNTYVRVKSSMIEHMKKDLKRSVKLKRLTCNGLRYLWKMADKDCSRETRAEVTRSDQIRERAAGQGDTRAEIGSDTARQQLILQQLTMLALTADSRENQLLTWRTVINCTAIY